MDHGGNKYRIDMCRGPLFGKIILFAIPLMIANATQLLFNAADLIIVGRFAPHEAMAAVGACGALLSLMLNFFFGLSVAANVLTARYIGARDVRRTAHSVHTAIAVALYGGILLALTGILISRPVLALMQTPASVLPKATLYMFIYCAGAPFILFYNFGSSILRATGDTRRPLIYMVEAGFLNVGLNLFFVLVFKMDVAGVALATLIANAFSSVMVGRALTGNRDSSRLIPRRIKFYPGILKDILKIGIPAGIQSSLFSFSNVIIQSTINKFGSEAVAGCAAGSSLEAITYVSFNAYYFAVISFVGQNHGARKFKRIRSSIIWCCLLGMATGMIFGWSTTLLGRRLLAIYNANPEVIEAGMLRVKFVIAPYFLCAAMDVVAGALRGLGHSLTPMIVSLMGACIFRILWVLFVFPLDPTLSQLFLSYPVSWVLVLAVNGGLLWIICSRMLRAAARRDFAPVSLLPLSWHPWHLRRHFSS